MARGETLGERRRRRRAERRDDRELVPELPVTSPRRLAQEREQALQAALEARPPWVKAIWATPARRVLLSGAFIALAAWIIWSAIADVGFLYRPRAQAGFVAAPLLIALFVLTLFEAIRDLARGENRQPTFYRLDHLLLGTRLGRASLIAYLGATGIALAVLLAR